MTEFSPLDLKIALIYIFQIGIGILGNVSLLTHYIFSRSSGCRLRSTDVILIHLTVANSLFIFFGGVPQIMVAFGRKDFLSDVGCIFFFYVLRMARGVSIDSTCLLSVFQVITISPCNSRWAALKLKALNYIESFNILSWVLHSMVSAIFPIYISFQRRNATNTMKNSLRYCPIRVGDNIILPVFAGYVSSHDVFCLGLMSWASVSMVLLLYRHRQQVKYIYKNKLLHRSSPEMRISQRVLVLVGTFVIFYAISSIIYVYMALFHNPSWWLVKMPSFITSCFPTISPFILMTSDPRVLRLYHTCCGRNAHLHLSREK